MTVERPPCVALDLRALLATLQRTAVDYTVIGGVAVRVHGHRPTTMDLDLVPDSTGRTSGISPPQRSCRR